MKLVVLAIGIPGSGKTTALTPLAAKYRMQRVSRDDIRNEWFGDPLIRTNQEEVWEEASRRMTEALGTGTSVILDSTFTERKKREDIIARARDAGAERVIGIVFTTSLDEAQARNRARKHVVREEVIGRSQAQLTEQPPSLAEGFDALYTNEQLAELEEKELKR